jgi:uncharacterized repeat protein (TIGR03803 family)
VAIFTAAVLLILSNSAVAAATERVLFSFPGRPAARPGSKLVFDAASARLYGTSLGGSAMCFSGCGLVFELTYDAGRWNPRQLYGFKGGSDGFYPTGNIVFDSAGNLYGVTQLGGTNGQGAVYRLTPDGGGKWTESLIYSFHGQSDGSQPNAGLTMDTAGNLYGTTNLGGANGVGTVYELSPAGGGSWTESVLHSFGAGQDGANTWAEVTLDASGNLYGTTLAGGTYGGGTVYELTPAGGVWTEDVLYSFTGGSDSSVPKAPVWVDASGNLYGTTAGEGPDNVGVVFELTQSSGGTWAEHTLHTFNTQGDGYRPVSGLTPDASGNLYGTTWFGGAHALGTVYQMRPGSNGNWTELVVHSFDGSDGNAPHTGVTIGKGVLFGTTQEGGASGSGVVFAIQR